MTGAVPRKGVPELSWAERELAQASAYDAIGEHYDEAFPHKEGQIECTRRLLEQLRPGAEVLDVGCGTGLPTTLELVEAGHHVTGIDISPGMLRTAAANVPGAAFRQLDIIDLDPEEQSFDAVTAFFSLLNLPKSHIPESLRLIRDCLRPGGLFGYAMVEADVDDIHIDFLGSRIRATGYPRYEWRAILAKAGFEQEWEHVISYAPATAQAAPEIQIFGLCKRTD